MKIERMGKEARRSPLVDRTFSGRRRASSDHPGAVCNKPEAQDSWAKGSGSPWRSSKIQWEERRDGLNANSERNAYECSRLDEYWFKRLSHQSLLLYSTAAAAAERASTPLRPTFIPFIPSE